MSAITLLGMSGAGKTHFSARLAGWGWEHYSCDLEIAKLLKIDVRVDDLSNLSAFIGKIGDPEKGGLLIDEFKRRQKLYYDAEVESLKSIPQATNTGKFVNDSTGSFCEITDSKLIASVAKQTKLVYIESDPQTHGDIIARAKSDPKPLYYPADRFDTWLDEYCTTHEVSINKIDPDGFAAWVFPHLFTSRLPKYDTLATQYGCKIAAKTLHAVQSEQDFLELIS